MKLERLGCGGSTVLGLAMLALGTGAKGTMKKAEFESDINTSDTYIRRAADAVDILDNSRRAVDACFARHQVCLEGVGADLSKPVDTGVTSALIACRDDVELCLARAGGGCR